jgi:PAS domain S-box-containing protein
MAERQPFVREFRVLWPDGSVHWIAARGQFIYDASGRAVRMLGAVLDVTEPKRAQEAQEQLLRRDQALVQSLGQIVYDWQLLENKLELRGNVEGILGYAPGELAGDMQTWTSHIHPEDLPAAMKELERAVRDQRPFDCEYRFRCKDGTFRWIHDRGMTYFDTHGQLIRNTGVLIDVTGRKRAEEELRVLADQLLRAQEDERRRIARELHDSVGQSLAAALISLRLAQEKKRRAEGQQKFQETIDILTQCSAEVRTMSYLLHPPLLEELGLEAALRELARGFQQRSGIQVQVEAPSRCLPLSHEATLGLYRVAQEALTNVHRHSGSPTAVVRLTPDAQRVVLEVRDEGKGLRAPLGEAAGESELLVGVGIAGMRERLRQLGGTLEIDSNGSGTTVRATLPLEQRSA